MKKLLLFLALAAAGLQGRANYGWYDASMSIGGVTTDITAWSTDGNNPTDLGIVTDMTVTSVAFNIWSDANDRGGANMFFRIWDGGSSQVGSDQDLHLGTATRIAGDHDFAISWSGSLDLASAVNLTLVPGKTYYVDMYAKTYGTSGDEWYSNRGSNFHAKLTYFAGSLYDNADNASLISALGAAKCTAVDITLFGRTLSKSGNWNTLCLPFEVSATQLAETTNPLNGATIKELDTSAGGSGFDASTSTLTLKFITATSIEAGKPYIVKWEGSSGSVNPVVFNDVTIGSTSPTSITSNDKKVAFVGTYSPVQLTKDDTSNLYMGAGSKLYYPNVDGFSINSFRAYFHIDPSASVKGFVMDFGEDDATSIDHSTLNIEHSEGAIYNVAGQRLNTMQKGISIVNGKKILK